MTSSDLTSTESSALQELQESLAKTQLFSAIREAPPLGIFRSNDDRKAVVGVTSRIRADTAQLSLWQIAFAKDCNIYEQWLRTERAMEKQWEDLEEQTYAEIIGFGKQVHEFTKYDPPDGPKLAPCRPGLSAIEPWANNRILLSQAHAPALCSDGQPDPDPTYVNASSMGYSFIAAAMPQNPDAREAFWRCIYEQDVSQVVMLNQPLEQDNRPYWPHAMSSSGKAYTDAFQTVHFGRVEVTLKNAFRSNPATWHRTFVVRVGDLPPREVEQFHYTQWPDMAVPSDPQLFLEGFLMPVLQRRSTHRANVLVHCHGGLGRTGTFICASILLIEREAFKRGELPRIPSVGERILALRKLRPDQVQASEQYKFIHRLVYGHEMPNRTEDQWSTLRNALKRSIHAPARHQNPLSLSQSPGGSKEAIHAVGAPSGPASSAPSPAATPPPSTTPPISSPFQTAASPPNSASSTPSTSSTSIATISSSNASSTLSSNTSSNSSSTSEIVPPKVTVVSPPPTVLELFNSHNFDHAHLEKLSKEELIQLVQLVAHK